MAMVKIHLHLLLAVILAIVVLQRNVSCGSYPINQETLSAVQSKKVVPRSVDHDEFNPSKQKRKVLKVSKKFFNKMKDEMEREAEQKEEPIVPINSLEQHPNYQPAYKTELQNNTILSAPLPTSNSSKVNSVKAGLYYNCPRSNSGDAILKADPFDCSCFYTCDWGSPTIRQCPSWTLWNDDSKTCDWYYNVKCATYWNFNS